MLTEYVSRALIILLARWEFIEYTYIYARRREWGRCCVRAGDTLAPRQNRKLCALSEWRDAQAAEKERVHGHLKWASNRNFKHLLFALCIACVNYSRGGWTFNCHYGKSCMQSGSAFQTLYWWSSNTYCRFCFNNWIEKLFSLLLIMLYFLLYILLSFSVFLPICI